MTVDTIMTVPFTHFTPDDVVLLAFTERNPVCQLLKTQREPEWFRLFFTAPMERMPRVRGLNFDDRDAFVVEHSAGFDTLTFWLRDTVLVNMDSLEVKELETRIFHVSFLTFSLRWALSVLMMKKSGSLLQLLSALQRLQISL